MGKKRGRNEGLTDQYGEFGSQDRDERFSGFSSGPGLKGGGSAGGQKKGGNVSFERHVPKFLQPYAHMLGKGRKGDDDEEEERPQIEEAGEDAEFGDDEGEEEAIHRALQDNPELAAELGDKYSKKVKALAEKEKGNLAFQAKDYARAIQHFTTCIELDPSCEVYFSNRSAAHANLGHYDEALEDAQSTLRLKPNWVKGHARLAAALFGLKRYSEAKDAYDHALKLEPNDTALQQGLDKALFLEMQQVRDKKHVFVKKSAGTRPKVAKPTQAPKKGGLLSFGDEEECV